MTAAWAVPSIAIFSAAACAALIIVLRPLLQRYSMAKPNLRSSHREPTPQGGGIAVIVATIAAAGLAMASLGVHVGASQETVFAAVVGMACVGAIDDIRPIPVLPRLSLQALAVAAVIYALPADLRLLGFLPRWLETALLFVGGLWFVNLVNFMDGIDWMTVAEAVPITAALAAIGYLGALSLNEIIVALSLGGAMSGFAHFNRPVAKLFLGDVGSLPIGLLLGWLLVLLAANGELTAALLLPLYYLADATLTLLRRLLNGEQIWQAHRTHFYQRATDRGLTVMEVVARVFAVNIGLAALALFTVIKHGRATDFLALFLGILLVGWLLHALSRGRPQPMSTYANDSFGTRDDGLL
jgi:UDP-N-acetylmuramyl pentapeptide phosphotransferase/UDP-N-acetylglucosamine-1-phosphate transferase